MQLRNGQSTVGGPKWTKIDPFRPKWTKMDHFGPFWSRECQSPVRNKAILTKMVVWTILDHFGPVHFPTVPRPLPSSKAGGKVFPRISPEFSHQRSLKISPKNSQYTSAGMAHRVATPLAWHKCLNSQTAQKCLR